MPTKFLESLGGKLAESWAANLLTPAFVFWAGGLGTWILRFGWQPLESWFKQQPEPLQVASVVGSLLVIVASAFVIQRFDLIVIRFLEGYWPFWMQPLRHWLIQRQQIQFNQAAKHWQDLAAKKDQQGLNREELEKYLLLDGQLMQFPAQLDRLMPTRLGNLLRAAESRPFDKYGLDAIICWPRLWLILPDGVKKELQEARVEFNTAARVWLWSLLFSIWVIWAWWAVLVSFFVAFYAYHWILDAAAIYCDLLESSFDLYRVNLYESLRWPLPTSPAKERALGLKLTEYLWRGSDGEQPEFTT